MNNQKNNFQNNNNYYYYYNNNHLLLLLLLLLGDISCGLVAYYGNTKSQLRVGQHKNKI
jgi:hypothetical protein